MEYLGQIAAIAGTLSLLWLTLRALGRMRPAAGKDGRLQVLQRVALANGSHLVAVRWDGQELLLATGSQPCTLVAQKAEARAAWAQS